MIARKDFLRRLLGGLLVSGGLMVASDVRAAPRPKKKNVPTPPPAVTPESSPSAPPPVENKREQAKLRLWKTSDASNVPVKLRFLLHDRPDSAAISPLEVQSLSYQFVNYTEVPAGPMVAEVSAPDRPTVRLPINLAAGSQSTLFIRLKGSTLSAEWIDDTLDPADASCEFNVYNLVFGNGDLQIEFGSLMTAHLAPGRSNARLSGIKRGAYSVNTSGVDGGGKNFNWTTEVDFRQYRKVTLLICPDSYGRIRPRVVTA